MAPAKRSQPRGSLLLSSPAWPLSWLTRAAWGWDLVRYSGAAPVLVVTTSRKDSSQDAFVNLWLRGRLVDLWRTIIVCVSRFKAVSPFYLIAAHNSGCETVGGGFVASLCMLSRAWLKIAPDTSSCSALFNHLCICQAVAESARLKLFVGSSHTSSWVAMTMVHVVHEYGHRAWRGQEDQRVENDAKLQKGWLERKWTSHSRHP